MAILRFEGQLFYCVDVFFLYDDKKHQFFMKGYIMTKKNIDINAKQIEAVKTLLGCDNDQIKICEKLLSCVFRPGIVRIETSFLQDFLKDGQKITCKTAFIDETTKEEIEKAGLLCNELHSAKKYFVSVEAGNYVTFTDIFAIDSIFRDFDEHSYHAIGSVIDESMFDRFRVNLFILE